MKAHLAHRGEAREARRRSAERDARASLPRLAELLVGLGARSVVLFGSLSAGRFDEDSDIDLATAGLGFHEAMKAHALCSEVARRQVEIVRLEDAPPLLARRIAELGERLA